MKKEIVIEYDVINETIQITKNEFTSFESLGVLEVAKVIVANDIHENND